MKKAFGPLLIVTTVMFACAPLLIAYAPYESTMLLVQKIFYFHVPSWIAMYTALAVCGVAGGASANERRAGADVAGFEDGTGGGSGVRVVGDRLHAAGGAPDGAAHQARRAGIDAQRAVSRGRGLMMFVSHVVRLPAFARS